MSYEVLGIAAPVMDHLLLTTVEYIRGLSGEIGGMEVVDHPTMIKIIEESGSVPQQITGGSSANVIKGLATLGHTTALTGCIGNDAVGETVIEHLQEKGILPLLVFSETPTAHVCCLIDPEGKRTCRSYLGASVEMSGDNLIPDHFHGTKLVHVEGYGMLNRKNLPQMAIQYAKAAGAVVSFDLSSFEVVESFHKELLNLLKSGVDIAFGNEDEVKALFGGTPEEGCFKLQELCDIAVVMVGEKGCWVGKGGVVQQCPAFPVRAIDTTGAGDLFASGFLHGYLKGHSLSECARFGALTAHEVVQVVGGEVPDARWRHIRHLMMKNQT